MQADLAYLAALARGPGTAIGIWHLPLQALSHVKHKQHYQRIPAGTRYHAVPNGENTL